MPSGS
ncbi:hypothetical protein F383_12599 [Gossypium arboreum]